MPAPAGRSAHSTKGHPMMGCPFVEVRSLSYGHMAHANNDAYS